MRLSVLLHAPVLHASRKPIANTSRQPAVSDCSAAMSVAARRIYGSWSSVLVARRHAHHVSTEQPAFSAVEEYHLPGSTSHSTGRVGVRCVGLRAIPTTSAPSHIRYTLCHEAETCLFIKEMGPPGFSVNAIDPILVFNGHDGILEVRINSEAQKWGGRWTCPIREAKWGWSGAGPNVFCVLIGRVKLNVYRRISV